MAGLLVLALFLSFSARLKRRTRRYRLFFFFNDTATTEIYTLSLHDALPISLTGNRTADKFLGPVQLRRVDQRHPEGKACAQRFFLSGLRVSPLSKTPRPLTESRDDGAIAKLDCPCRGGNGDPGSILAPGIRPRSKHRSSREERRCAKSGEVASVQQSILHVSGLMRLLQRTDRRSQKTSGWERIPVETHQRPRAPFP